MSATTVVNVFSGLNNSSAAGPDGAPSSAELSLPFYLLFESSLDEEVLPNL